MADDIFVQLIDAARKRKDDSPSELQILGAMRSVPSGRGTLGDLHQRIPTMKPGRIAAIVMNLALRQKVVIEKDNRWRIVEA